MNRKETIKNYFNNIADSYFKYQGRYSYYYNDISKYFNFYLNPDDSILEIGCGCGNLLNKLNGKRKVGIDFSEKMIQVAKERYPELEFIISDAEIIELNEKFDVIVLSGVVGYVDNLIEVFESLKKVCHPNTRILVSYYNFLWEPILRLGETVGIKKKSPKQSWLSKRDIENVLYLSGFEAFRTTRSMILPVNIPLISFIFNKYIARLPFFNLLCVNKFINARPVFHLNNNTKKEFSTSVVIPARNESGNIENAILQLPQFGKHIEIIFVEGNSTDNTWEKIQEIQQKYKDTHDIKIIQQEGKGKGDAVRKGYSIATGDILMILDADLTVAPEDLPKFYNAIASGKGEFINGSRLVYPMEKEAMRILNTMGNKFFSSIFSWLLEQPIKDTLCGTKVMFREDYIRLQNNRKFFGDFDPFGDFDLLFGAYKLNLKIIDLPIRYRERKYGDTNISRFSHGFLLLRMCFYAAGKIKFW
ncbi:MAG: glycosyl transferase [Bacteroidetes bacterium GWA2_31_9b]|nr:MAG: glycosyl transferase [Bacteroidetes bacterium GWA2_31_9b]